MAPTFNQRALELASKQGKASGRVSIGITSNKSVDLKQLLCLI